LTSAAPRPARFACFLLLALSLSLCSGTALARAPDKKPPPKKAAPAAAAAKKASPAAKGPAREDPRLADKPSKSIADTTPAESGSAPTPGPVDEAGKTLQRGERIEFDARLIQGQTAKAGAVYLFERVQTPLRSMVKERTSFRDKVVRKVFPDEEGTR
jgi:hypothetical protein